ncbi:hypothetical protein TGAM01_v201808 [Trichoderma gamsii]|uniref:Uncharacterized protein n=1 Tax=Trichoderma gamsii TaxID=398673 RepID=A0A2P4ZZ34_9HYPO|nr:hypothetical protein TGAM01_v201808 [Trichoderma gamsii]PON29559.1 hypothetical protein TGAM01_v201808 [Trichoderma gamsii]
MSATAKVGRNAKEESPGEWKLTGPPDILVTRESAIGHYSDRVQHKPIAFNQNHSDLPKFGSSFDGNYRAIEPFFKECYDDALEVIQKRFSDEAIKPQYTERSKGRSRATCPSCSQKYYSQIELLQHLKAEGNDICFCKVLRYAVENGLSTASLLLLEDGRINAKVDTSGLTILHYAAKHGRLEMVQLLLDRGADLNARDLHGSTPLYHSVELDVARLFLDRGADIETKHREEVTSLIKAAKLGNTEMIKLLLDRRANIEARDCHGQTPLNAATRRGQTDVIKLLLDRSANIETKNKEARTPLLVAARDGRADVVRLLLERGADTESRSNSGVTPLIAAARGGRADIVELLLDGGAHFKRQDDSGKTPLMWAVESGKADVVEVLRNRGARKSNSKVNVISRFFNSK